MVKELEHRYFFMEDEVGAQLETDVAEQPQPYHMHFEHAVAGKLAGLLDDAFQESRLNASNDTMLEFNFSSAATASAALADVSDVIANQDFSNLSPENNPLQEIFTESLQAENAQDLSLGLNGRGADFLYSSLFEQQPEDMLLGAEQYSLAATSTTSETVLNLFLPSYTESTLDNSAEDMLLHLKSIMLG